MYPNRWSNLNRNTSIILSVAVLATLALAAVATSGLLGRQASLPIDTSSGNPDRIQVLLRAPLTRAQVAEAGRYTGMAGDMYNLYGSTAWTRAPKALSRAQMAEAARYTGFAAQKYNLFGSTAWTRAPKLPLTRAQIADAARYTALAGHYVNMYGSTAWTRAPKNELTRSQLAEAARWTALAIHHGKPPETISNTLAAVLGE